MGWQGVTTGFLVALCAAYSLWTLLPTALRTRWSARLRGQPLSLGSAGGCSGCDGCGNSGRPVHGAGFAKEGVIRIVRRQSAT